MTNNIKVESFVTQFSDESRDDSQNAGSLVIQIPDATVNPRVLLSSTTIASTLYANNLIIPLPNYFFYLIPLAWTPVYFIRRNFF